VASRNLSSNGGRAFFETTEALVSEDTNGQGGCPPIGTLGTPSCIDVYEWEAPGIGGCDEGDPAYSALNGGCLYLISTGKSEFPSFFADASLSGDDAFFFTRERLVGQDEDELQDVYDARVGGGLASQNPPPPNPCEGADACHEPAPPPPAETTPATPNFVGPGDPTPKHKKQKAKKHKKKHMQKKHRKKHKQAKGKAKGNGRNAR
jgi:hypothetical protein